MKQRLMLLCFFLACFMLIPAAYAADDAQEKWLKYSQLGPYSPAKQDWAAIESAAKKELNVVIFSVSSRIFNIQKDFN